MYLLHERRGTICLVLRQSLELLQFIFDLEKVILVGIQHLLFVLIDYALHLTPQFIQVVIELMVSHIDLLLVANGLLGHKGITQSSRIGGTELFESNISEAVELIQSV